jgi:uncharacterized protein
MIESRNSNDNKWSNLEIVLKISERCNINCKYCYMFNLDYSDTEKHPAIVSLDTVAAVNRWALKAVEQLAVRNVTFILHGGEPLLMKKDKFEKICRTLRSGFAPEVSVSFGMQSNGMLVDVEWIKLLSRLKVSVGISIDGSEKFHDSMRVDHKGRGTYSKTIKGVKLLQRASNEGLIPKPGAITVITPSLEAEETFLHLVEALNLHNINFVLPMDTHDSIGEDVVPHMTKFLESLCLQYVKQRNPYLAVRILTSFLKFLVLPEADSQWSQFAMSDDSIIVSIASNGSLGGDDELKPINFGQNLGDVRTMEPIEFVNNRQLRHRADIEKFVSPECGDCEWVGYCRGGAQNGSAINRFSVANKFGNPSVLCGALKTFYSTATSLMLSQGLPEAHVVKRLEDAASLIEVRPRDWFISEYERCGLQENVHPLQFTRSL